MELGQKLKEKRAAAKLSQEDLAKAVGVSRQTVSSWENNRSYPFPEKLAKRYEGEGQYAIYSFEWDGGIFLFRMNFE